MYTYFLDSLYSLDTSIKGVSLQKIHLTLMVYLSLVIPYSHVFLMDTSNTPHIYLQAHITSISPTSITLSKPFPEHGIPTTTLHYDFAIYALGSHLPSPLNLWGTDKYGNIPAPEVEARHKARARYLGEKPEGIAWLKENQKLVEDSPSILVVGGGALGIRTYPSLPSRFCC